MIPLNDFQRQWLIVRDALHGSLDRVGASGWYVLGREVEEFERALAKVFGLSHAIGTGNGLDAVEIALRSIGVRPGDKVLTTPLSAFATTLAILRSGGIPVFADVDSNGLIDLDACREALHRDPAIRTLLPVHLFGMPCDLDALAQLTRDFEVKLVEDCAQSILATDAGRGVGTVGLVAATSFYPTKNLGAMGDGGAVLCNDPEISARAAELRNYGQSAQYVHSRFGLNSRLDEMHAASLMDAFLPRLAAWTARRRVIAARYLKEIDNPSIRSLTARSTADPSWHLFPLFVAVDARDAFREYMRASGIQTGIHYPRLISDQDGLSEAGPFEIIGDLRVASQLTRTEVSIPIHPHLYDEEVTAVIEACNRWRP